MAGTIIEHPTLTNREKECLAFIALGYTNHATAKHLCVSFATVKKTHENIFRKLRAKDRANAVAIAFVHDFIDNTTFTSICEKYNLHADFTALQHLA